MMIFLNHVDLYMSKLKEKSYYDNSKYYSKYCSTIKIH